jgi:hypothetical protein
MRLKKVFANKKKVVIGVVIAVAIMGMLYMMMRPKKKEKEMYTSCNPGDPNLYLYKMRVKQDDGSWVCPDGYKDTGCNWTDHGAIYGAKQCRVNMKKEVNVGNVKYGPLCNMGAPNSRLYRAKTENVCPPGWTETGCADSDACYYSIKKFMHNFRTVFQSVNGGRTTKVVPSAVDALATMPGKGAFKSYLELLRGKSGRTNSVSGKPFFVNTLVLSTIISGERDDEMRNVRVPKEYFDLWLNGTPLPLDLSPDTISLRMYNLI